MDALFPSKERVERDGVLVYAEGDDIPSTDTDELKRQGYDPADAEGARAVIASERIERDGVLLYAEGDEIPADVAEQLGIKGQTKTSEADSEAPAPSKSRSKKA